MGAFLVRDEYRAAPSAVDSKSLVAGGDAAANDAELDRLIRRAGGWIDNFTNWGPDASLLAGAITETRRARVTNRGEFILHPSGAQRITALTAFSYGSDFAALAVYTPLTSCWVELGSIHVPVGAATLSLPAIQFSRMAVGDEWIVQYTYNHGWAGTTLAVASTVGQSSFTVVSAAGIIAGDIVEIWDGVNTELVTVTSVAGAAVTIQGTLTKAHQIGAGVSNLPPDLKLAAVCVVSGFIKDKGSEALAMTNTQAPGPVVGQDPSAGNDLRRAREMLMGYQKIR